MPATTGEELIPSTDRALRGADGGDDRPADRDGANERRKPVLKKRHRIQARTHEFEGDRGRRYGERRMVLRDQERQGCSTPPRKVPAPVITPRSQGLPRPVRSPVSDSPSDKDMLTLAPIAVASPAKKA